MQMEEQINPIDPTRALDKKERERFEKLKWLPSLTEEVLTRQPVVRRKQLVASHIIAPRSVRKELDQAIFVPNKKGADKFPLIEIRNADKAIRTLKQNGKSRFLMNLHDLALATERKANEDLKMRVIDSIDSYEWNSVKRISHEPPLGKYIELMTLKGLANLEVEAATKAETVQFVPDVKEESSEANNEIVQIDTTKKESEDTQLINSTRQFLYTSPFRAKPRGEAPRAKYFQEKDMSWTFGRPAGLKSEAPEFQRAFNDVEALGSTVFMKSKLLSIETDVLKVNAILPTETISTKIAERKYTTIKGHQANGPSYSEPLPKILQGRFNEEREKMHGQLHQFLSQRAKNKLDQTLKIAGICQTGKIATKYLKIYMLSKRGAKNVPTQNIWQVDSHIKPKNNKLLFHKAATQVNEVLHAFKKNNNDFHWGK